jgi:hypothetical protein
MVKSFRLLLLVAVVLAPSRSYSQQDSSAPVAQAGFNAAAADLQKDLDEFVDRQGKIAGVHKTFAFLTAGCLLLGDILGTYHFFELRDAGHRYCDAHSNGADADNIDPAVFRAGILDAWGSSNSQLFRVLHGGSIALGTIFYTATATMELSMPRMIKDDRPLSSVNLHHDLFYLHAGLMIASIGLGFWESYALSRGEHDVVHGVGIAHLIIGYALPIVITTSGLAYKLDL